MHLVDPITKERIDAKEEKRYLLLITWASNSSGSDITEWRRIIGKKDAIDFIFANIEELELEDSFILSESASVSQAWSLYTFIRFMKEQGVLDAEMESEFDMTFEDFTQFIVDNYEITEEELDDMYDKELNL